MSAIIFWTVCAMLVGWLVASVDYVKADEVGMLRFFGWIWPKVFRPGIMLVPWVWGIDLVRIPTKLFRLSYEGRADHKIYTKDYQLALPEVTFYVRFPYNKEEVSSLINMIRSGVPLEEKELAKWAEDILMPALRQVFSKRPYMKLVGNVDLTILNAQVNDALRVENSILRTCGVMGTDHTDTTPGTGQAFVEVELVSLTDELQKALQAPAVAEQLAKAAEATKRQTSQLVVGPLHEAMDDWVLSQVPEDGSKTFAQVMAELITSGEYARHEVVAKDLILANGGNLSVNKIELGGPGGQQLPGSLQYISVGGGGGAGVLIGGKGSRQGKRSDGSGGSDEKEKAKDELRRKAAAMDAEKQKKAGQ